jgi:hypothetical protein
MSTKTSTSTSSPSASKARGASSRLSASTATTTAISGEVIEPSKAVAYKAERARRNGEATSPA